ncbi:MAG: UvrD-helicase domain-containing protein [Victivallaceae bacterium]|nr:UvrD-helicase domain-containing protein [Victivallaceae bacterium]
MKPEELLAGLNPAQREAVSTIDGPVLVLAGAGTGKTRVITYRIAYMIASGIAPGTILGMTFTNKAAREMRERLVSLVEPAAAGKVTLGTFHSFCARFLRAEIKALGYLGNFTIADDSDQQGLMKQAMALAGISKEQLPFQAAAAYIGRQKNAAKLPPDADRHSKFEAQCALVYTQYQQLLENQNCLDFDDLLLLTAKILHDFPEVLEKYRDRHRYLLIDEYQDTNFVQFDIVRMLCAERRNLCVVGDDDQSIYSWRGADIGNILDFPTLYPGAKSIKLEQNYRSTNTILKAANSILGKGDSQFAKRLWSDLGTGEPLLLVRAEDEEAEAGFVAGHIPRLLAENPHADHGDIAVLYRSNHLSRQLETALRLAGIPYRLVGGQEFYQRKEIKDAAAYLKLVANPRDNQSLLRILALPPRGLADKAVSLLKERCSRSTPMAALLGDGEFRKNLSAKGAAGAENLASAIAEATEKFASPGNLAGKVSEYLASVGYLPGLQLIYRDLEDARKRRENVDEFINSVAQFEQKHPNATLGEFLENFALLEENDRTDEPDKDQPAVTLSTVHAAKGLEFPFVFLVGMEKDLFPHERAVEEGNTDEELRLFYVAVTRAKLKMIISATRRRMERGVYRDRRTSDFVRRLPAELCEEANAEDLVRKLTPSELESQFRNIFKNLK